MRASGRPRGQYRIKSLWHSKYKRYSALFYILQLPGLPLVKGIGSRCLLKHSCKRLGVRCGFGRKRGSGIKGQLFSKAVLIRGQNGRFESLCMEVIPEGHVYTVSNCLLWHSLGQRLLIVTQAGHTHIFGSQKLEWDPSCGSLFPEYKRLWMLLMRSEKKRQWYGVERLRPGPSSRYIIQATSVI